MAKERPKTIFVDGLPAYQKGFNKVFYSRYKSEWVELISRVGLRSRKNNNIVERLHGTLKNRTKVTRGLKDIDTVDTLLKGWTIHYNFVREHQSIGITPAQKAGIDIENDWHTLIEMAIEHETEDELVVKKALGLNEDNVKQSLKVKRLEAIA